MKRNNKGFTLAELLIVVAVIAVLVAVAIPTFGSQLEKSRQAVDKANLRSAYAAAKIAILNQTDSDNILQTVDMTKTSFDFWYFEDELKAVENDKTAADATYSMMGKATTSKVLNTTDKLPTGVTYTGDGTTEATTLLSDSSTGTTEKGIVVTIAYNATNNVFSLSDVTFKKTATKTDLAA